MPRKELTQQQENFCKYYVDIGIGSKAYIKAYPKAEFWKRNTLDCEVQRMLNNPKINHRIEELNNEKTRVLMNSTKLSHRKLLETALNTMLECNTPAERQHFVSLIKLLFQKEGMLQPETAVQVNVQNNVVNDISDFLGL